MDTLPFSIAMIKTLLNVAMGMEKGVSAARESGAADKSAFLCPIVAPSKRNCKHFLALNSQEC